MIKGILFDKDGTLIDFFSLWLQTARDTIPVFLQKNQIEASDQMCEYMLQTIGITNGKVDPKGALAYKSYGEIADDLAQALAEQGISLSVPLIQLQIAALFEQHVMQSDMKYRTFCDLTKIFGELKRQKMVIGLATADTINSAVTCLKKLNIYQYFDFIGADDGRMRPKPAKDMFMKFSRHFGLKAEEIAVVGDTYNDILFARQNGGIAIGVLSGVSKQADFDQEADYILESVSGLPALTARINGGENCEAITYGGRRRSNGSNSIEACI